LLTRAEDRHDASADVFIQRAAQVKNNVSHTREIFVQYLNDPVPASCAHSSWEARMSANITLTFWFTPGGVMHRRDRRHHLQRWREPER